MLSNWPGSVGACRKACVTWQSFNKLPLPVDSLRKPDWPAVDVILILLVALREIACIIDHRRV
jgi:hypothetical protein